MKDRVNLRSQTPRGIDLSVILMVIVPFILVGATYYCWKVKASFNWYLFLPIVVLATVGEVLFTISYVFSYVILDGDGLTICYFGLPFCRRHIPSSRIAYAQAIRGENGDVSFWDCRTAEDKSLFNMPNNRAVRSLLQKAGIRMSL